VGYVWLCLASSFVLESFLQTRTANCSVYMNSSHHHDYRCRHHHSRVAGEGRRVLHHRVHGRQHASRGLRWNGWVRLEAGQQWQFIIYYLMTCCICTPTIPLSSPASFSNSSSVIVLRVFRTKIAFCAVWAQALGLTFTAS